MLELTQQHDTAPHLFELVMQLRRMERQLSSAPPRSVSKASIPRSETCECFEVKRRFRA